MEISKAVGFVGLGAMGYPMAQQLARKLPSQTKLLVFDVLSGAVDDIRAEFDGKIEACFSSKEVTEGSASQLCLGRL